MSLFADLIIIKKKVSTGLVLVAVKIVAEVVAVVEAQAVVWAGAVAERRRGPASAALHLPIAPHVNCQALSRTTHKVITFKVFSPKYGNIINNAKYFLYLGCSHTSGIPTTAQQQF